LSSALFHEKRQGDPSAVSAEIVQPPSSRKLCRALLFSFSVRRPCLAVGSTVDLAPACPLVPFSHNHLSSLCILLVFFCGPSQASPNPGYILLHRIKKSISAIYGGCRSGQIFPERIMPAECSALPHRHSWTRNNKNILPDRCCVHQYHATPYSRTPCAAPDLCDNFFSPL
jgi:hypothetical protein